MNKHELRSAYNKIALSDEFKASAKEKLLACCDDNTAAEESVQELHTAKEVKLSSQPKKQPWKIAVGACAAAAAVGLGVWGVSAVIGRDVPVADTSGANTQVSDTTSVSTTTHTVATDVIEDVNDDAERAERINRYDTENPVIVFKDSLRNGDSEYDFEAYIYQIMGETEDTFRGNCAIEIFKNGEVVDRNMLLVGYTLGQNGTEFLKDGDSGYFSLVELQSGSLLLSTREQGDVTEATLYTIKGDRIAQIERYFEDPADRPERDSSVRSFNLSRSYTTEKDDIIFDIGGEEVRVTIDFDELTLKCEDGFESMVYCGYDEEDGYQATVDANYGEVRVLFDYYREDTMPWDEETEFYIEGFPEVQFIWDHENVKAVDASGNEEVLFGGMPIWSVYLTDLNGDGLREICSGVSIGSGIVDDHIVAYDYAAKKLYELSDRGYNDYYLSYSGLTPLMVMVYERDYASGELTGYCGALKLDGEKLTFERGEDINTAAMKQYSLPVTVMPQSEQGGLTFPQDEEISAEVKFSLPASWECSASTASYAYAKVFEIGGVWRAYEGINTDSYKTDYAYGATITVIEEKWGTDDDLYEYFIHTSTPIKYAPDGTYDVYRYVVESNGYYVTVSVMSDMGVEQETIDRVLESVEINTDEENEEVQDSDDTESSTPFICDKPLDINYTDTMLRYYDVKQVGESHFDEYESEWATYLRLEIELPMSWRHEMNAGSIDGVAYCNDEEIFSYEQPIKASEGIDTAALLARTTEGEEKYGTDGDLFEYRIITSDEYIYVVNSGDYNITLTFDANAGLSQSTIDSVLRSVLMYEYEKCLDAIDGYFPIGDVWKFIHNGVEYSQDILTYRFVMDKYANILEGDPENYNNINDYLGALKNSTYIGAAERLCWTGEDMRYYIINDDVILGITLCGKDLYPYVDAEELLSKYDADEIFHAYIYERIKG